MVRSHWKLVSLKIPIPYPDASKRIRIRGIVPAVLNLLMVFMFSKTALKYRVEGLFPGRTKVRSFFPLDADADRWREQTLAAIVVMAQR